MQHLNPEVNIRVAGLSPKRADLYIVAADGVVSIEFKYLGVAGLRDVGACAAQLGRHAAHHAKAVMVLYSNAQVPEHLTRQLAKQAGTASVRILNIIGPAIPVAKGAPNIT